MPRAAVLPNVEKSAAGADLELAERLATSAFASAWPVAYATSMRASGPTSITLPS